MLTFEATVHLITGRKVLGLQREVAHLSFPFVTGKRRLVTLTFASWNPIGEWLRLLDALRE
jgi:hypothetical protein